MLAKLWKKLLLAICIIACLYNIMHKLVTRTSLETQLKSVQNQPSIINSLYKQEDDNKNENIVVENKKVIENTTEQNTTKTTENTNTTTFQNEINNSIVVIY